MPSPSGPHVGRVVRWLVAGLALTLAVPALPHAQDAASPQSVDELKAVLADLRRRLAERQGAGGAAADARLRTAQQQIERLVVAIGALRRERDRLRADLGAARAELAARPQALIDAERRLEEAYAENARLREQGRSVASPRPPLPAALAAVEPLHVSQVLDGSSFAPGSARLTGSAMPRVAAIVATIRAHPDARVRIVAYADDGGGRAEEHSLSLARAQVVRARLLELLPEVAGTLDIEDRGELERADGDEALEARITDRRVVVTVER